MVFINPSTGNELSISSTLLIIFTLIAIFGLCLLFSKGVGGGGGIFRLFFPFPQKRGIQRNRAGYPALFLFSIFIIHKPAKLYANFLEEILHMDKKNKTSGAEAPVLPLGVSGTIKVVPCYKAQRKVLAVPRHQ
jgi:hypothetical protein